MNHKDQCETLIVCLAAAVFVALTAAFYPTHQLFSLVVVGVSLIFIFGAGLDVLPAVGLKLTDNVQSLKKLRLVLLVALIAAVAFFLA